MTLVKHCFESVVQKKGALRCKVSTNAIDDRAVRSAMNSANNTIRTNNYDARTTMCTRVGNVDKREFGGAANWREQRDAPTNSMHVK